MKPTHVSAVLVSLILCAAAMDAQEASKWRLFGSNEIVLEDFNVSGEESDSPFRLEGMFITDRLNLNVGYKATPWRELVVRAELLGTNNDYFSDQGIVVANLSLNLEDGSFAVPYRFGAGDLFVDFSRRTLQRQIRGTTFELQPELGNGTHSIIFATGSGVADWSDTFHRGDDLYFHGLSYLWTSRSGQTSVVANVIDSAQAAGTRGAVPIPAVDRDQLVTSVYAETRVAHLLLEGEVSMVDEDRAGPGGEDGTSFYAQLGRNQGPFTWRARFEQNESGYAPIGAVGVIPDYRIGELHGRYRLTPRSMLRGRVQWIEQNFDSADALRSTDVLGLAWESRPLTRRPSFRIEANADLNRIEEQGSTDALFQNYRLRVADRLSRRLDASYELKVRDSADDQRPLFDRRLFDHELMVGSSFASRFAMHGRVRAGVAYRRQRESAEYDEWSPLFEASLTRGDHALRLHLGFMDQRFLSRLVDDLEYQTRRLAYSFSPGNHAVSIEAGQELRERGAGRETDSTRIAVRYRYSFERRF